MIVSHAHQFIFIHCRKTGGSSCTAYLNRFLGPQDIQTAAWSESLRGGGKFNRRFFKDVLSREGIQLLANDGWGRIKQFRFPKPKKLMLKAHRDLYKSKLGDSPAHPQATSIRTLFPFEWENYFKICFVRNPYEQVVSDYIWRSRNKNSNISFSDFIKLLEDRSELDSSGMVPHAGLNWGMYTINNKIAVDFIGRTERLIQDMEDLCGQLKIPFSPEQFSHSKKGRANKDDYRRYYADADVERVSKLFEQEIAAFDYSFPRSPC